MIAGIDGMQPPNLQGGARNERRWSCYDPERETKEDYHALQMPSCAMTAAVEGSMLLPEGDGKFHFEIIS